ncbi:hypothetical protein ACLB2K_002892 [Fragaria x ananassa]
MKRPKTHGGCKSVCSDGSEWETLLTEVAFPVLEKLLEPLDHVRFATVCKRWSSIAKDYNHTTQRWRSKQVLPMLMIPSSSASLSQGVVLYSVSERRMYNNIVLPVPANEKYCGFSHGWLASIDESLTNITLRKFPAYRNGGRNVIHLPPLKHDDFTYNYNTKSLPKVILSADPTLHPDSYVVLAILCHSHKAAYIAGQQNHWKYPMLIGSFPEYGHAIFYRDDGYLINYFGSTLLRFDVHFSLLQTRPEISPKRCTYFVETTEGNLFLVEKVSARPEVSAATFKVYQLVTDRSLDTQVLEVNSIGDEALFVCESHSMSVLASNFRGCQPNSIYYAYNSGSTWEMGIFSLENKTTTRLYSLNHCESDYMPFWITPSFEGLC